MLLKYYTYEKQAIHCDNCKWNGNGKEAGYGDLYPTFIEINCPKCYELIGTVALPTHEEVLKWGTEKEQTEVRWSLGLRNRMKVTQFNAFNKLQNIDGVVDLLFKEKQADNDYWLEVFANGDLLWREVVKYQYYERFIKILKQLERRYFGRIRDIKYNTTYILFGDEYDLHKKRATPEEKVERAIEKIKEHFFNKTDGV